MVEQQLPLSYHLNTSIDCSMLLIDVFGLKYVEI